MKESTKADTGESLNPCPSPSGLEANLEYFRSGDQENKDYWQCFNGRPDFEHQTVVEVGCGHGSLCIDVAQSTASSKVIGLDINAELIDFAKWNLHANYPMLESRVEFHCIDVRQFPVFEVDVVLSKATFEHIIDLVEVLDSIKAHLKAGGRVYTQFSPLYHSPYGGHGRIHDALPFPMLPWGHLMVSERYMLNCVNRRREQPALSVAELGLNKLSVSDFRRIFENSGLRVRSFETNLPGKSWKAKVMSALSRVSILEKYMTYAIIAVLEKPA